MICGHKWNFEKVPCGFCTWERLFGKKTIGRKGDDMSTHTVRVECYGREYSLMDILNRNDNMSSFSLTMSFKTIPRENDFIRIPSSATPYNVGRVFAVIHDYYGDVRILLSGPF